MSTPEELSRRIALSFATVIVLIGAAGLAGWITGALIEFAIRNHVYPISVMSSISLLLLGATLLIIAIPLRHSAFRLAPKIISLVIAAIAIVICLSYLISPDFDIEKILFDVPNASNYAQFMHVSPVASLAFAMAALAIFLSYGKKHVGRIPGILSITVFSIGALVLLGYAYGTPQIYGGESRPIAIESAIGLMFLGWGIMASIGPKAWPFREIFIPDVKYRLQRNIITLVVAIFLVFSLILTKLIPYTDNPLLLSATFTIVVILGLALLITGLSETITGQIARAEREKTAALESLRKANDKLAILDSLTRHDILNQISLSLTEAELAKMHKCDAEATASINNIMKIDRAIISMLNFSKEYRNVGSEEPKWLRLRDVVLKAIHDREIKEIVVDANFEDYQIYADPMLEKVFYNLFDDTLRYGGKATDVKIECRLMEENGSLMIVYADNGIGIPPDEKEKIFERGFGKNTGLGLFLSRRILDITGISIKETGAPGEGAKFEIKVPRGQYRMNA